MTRRKDILEEFLSCLTLRATSTFMPEKSVLFFSKLLLTYLSGVHTKHIISLICLFRIVISCGNFIVTIRTSGPSWRTSRPDKKRRPSGGLTGGPVDLAGGQVDLTRREDLLVTSGPDKKRRPKEKTRRQDPKRRPEEKTRREDPKRRPEEKTFWWTLEDQWTQQEDKTRREENDKKRREDKKR